MSAPYLIAIASWPLIALGFAVAIAAQRRGTQSGLATLLMFVYRYQSRLNLFVQDLTLIPGGCAVCWDGTYLWRNADRLDRNLSLILNSKTSAVVSIIMGIGLTAYGAISLGSDFIMARSEVAGVVTNKYVRHNRYGKYYYVELEGRRFSTTADIYAQIQPLSHVHATVGHGTGNIFTATN